MEIIIDFLVRLITPMEGVDYAIAPILLAGLAQVPGLIKGISASNAAVEQGREIRPEPLEIKRQLKEPCPT